MILQGEKHLVGLYVKLIPNIKEVGRNAYPSRLFVASTKANVWVAFCMMYRDIDKMPFSDSFWQRKIINTSIEKLTKQINNFM